MSTSTRIRDLINYRYQPSAEFVLSIIPLLIPVLK